MDARGAEMKRRTVLHASLAGLGAGVPGWGLAQSGAGRTVELIVPYAAGGGVDAMARAFAREAARLTGGSWVVVNKDGAAGVLGFAALTNAAPDGQTLVFSPASPLVISPHVSKSLPFKPERVEPVCQVFENVFTIAVKADSPITSMQDLVARAKAAPGKLSYGHAGTGSVPHLGVASVEKALGIRFNAIPYRGDAGMLPQLLGGELDFGAPAVSSIGGKPLRVLAVLAEQRHPGAPDAPTLTQLGYPPVVPGLNGLYAPVGLPAPVLESLQGLCQKVAESAEFRKAAQGLQQSVAYLPGAAFKKRLDGVSRENAALIPSMNLDKN